MASNGRPSLDPSVDPNPSVLLREKSITEIAKISEHLPINWADMPSIPFYGSFLGFNDQWYRAGVALGILNTRWRAQRNLSPEEVQIVALQTGKAVTNMAHEVPLMVGSSILFTSQGWSTFRFPFYQPRKDFNPDVFPTKSMPLIQGPRARFLWHFTRVCAYTTLSHWTLRTLFVSYTMSVKNAEFERDPRLADLRSSIKQAATARMTARRQVPVPERPQTLSQQREQQQQRQEQRFQQESQQESSQEPSQESLEQSYDQQYQSPAQQQMQQMQQMQQRAQRWSAPQQPPQTQAPSRDDDDAGLDSFDDFDDASPTAPAFQGKPWQQASAPPGGTAWDRVRAGAASGQHTGDGHHKQPAWKRGQKPAAAAAAASEASGSQQTAGDYTFDEKDEEKSYARDKAQKDFDAMLDKERSGENDGEGRRKRW